MAEQTIVVHNASGLHARPAAVFVKTAKSFPGTAIEVSKDGVTRDAKSILGVITLAVTKGTTITIRTSGEEADAALKALVDAIESGLGE